MEGILLRVVEWKFVFDCEDEVFFLFEDCGCLREVLVVGVWYDVFVKWIVDGIGICKMELDLIFGVGKDEVVYDEEVVCWFGFVIWLCSVYFEEI